MKDLDQLFQSFETGIRSVKAAKPKEYLKSIGLDYNELRIGFNSGQFHHGKPQQVKDHFEALGVLKKSDMGVRDTSMTAYTVFGRYGIVFPLFDSENKVVNLYAQRFDMATPIAEYLNKKGLYPSYPTLNTKRLYIAPTLMDAASLLQSKALDHREAVLALHDGEFLNQHKQAVESLKELEQIIILKR
ncbi:MAG: hypothetical protein EOO51_00225 [Flavobacterium sp.]|nr:MAG: hypothetical protein EOO51_00225 [Flavobacterium sp.]